MLQRLIGYKDLTEKRGQLKANLNVFTIAPSWPKTHKEDDVILNKEDFDEYLAKNKQDDLLIDDYRRLIQAVQAITKLKADMFIEIEHPYSHATFGEYEFCRIPVNSPLTPSIFMNFILRNFYNYAFRKKGVFCEISEFRYNNCITENEKGIL